MCVVVGAGPIDIGWRVCCEISPTPSETHSCKWRLSHTITRSSHHRHLLSLSLSSLSHSLSPSLPPTSSPSLHKALTHYHQVLIPQTFALSPSLLPHSLSLGLPPTSSPSLHKALTHYHQVLIPQTFALSPSLLSHSLSPSLPPTSSPSLHKALTHYHQVLIPQTFALSLPLFFSLTLFLSAFLPPPFPSLLAFYIAKCCVDQQHRRR